MRLVGADRFDDVIFVHVIRIAAGTFVEGVLRADAVHSLKIAAGYSKSLLYKSQFFDHIFQSDDSDNHLLKNVMQNCVYKFPGAQECLLYHVSRRTVEHGHTAAAS
uniref:Uncharacterized protein n=1 Tax=Romanomermis culicivorax TaxID=13658 RepID=A0A915HH09_ROMCU